MEQLILIVHVLAAVAIVGLILLQQGKGADMGASFGAGASQTLFGSSGSGNALTKGTAILAALFFATSFALAVVAKNKATASGDVDIPDPAVVETPAAARVVEDIPAGEAGADDRADIPAAPAADVPASSADAADAAEDDIPQ